MSWTGLVPDTPSESIAGAIDACVTEPTEAELGNGPKAQLAAARRAAHDLAGAGVVKGTSFEITLGGHSDPGDQSTQADYVHVQVTQRRAASAESPVETGATEETLATDPSEVPGAGV